MLSFTSKFKIAIGALGCSAGIGVGVAVGLALQSSFNTAVAPAIIGTIAGIVAIPIAAVVLYGVAMCAVVTCGVAAFVCIAGPVLTEIETGRKPSNSTRSSQKQPLDTTAEPAFAISRPFNIMPGPSLAISKPYTPIYSRDVEAGSSSGHAENTPLTIGLAASKLRV